MSIKYAGYMIAELGPGDYDYALIPFVSEYGKDATLARLDQFAQESLNYAGIAEYRHYAINSASGENYAELAYYAAGEYPNIMQMQEQILEKEQKELSIKTLAKLTGISPNLAQALARSLADDESAGTDAALQMIEKMQAIYY